jgi:hypothetical protein
MIRGRYAVCRDRSRPRAGARETARSWSRRVERRVNQKVASRDCPPLSYCKTNGRSGAAAGNVRSITGCKRCKSSKYQGSRPPVHRRPDPRRRTPRIPEGVTAHPSAPQLWSCQAVICDRLGSSGLIAIAWSSSTHIGGWGYREIGGTSPYNPEGGEAERPAHFGRPTGEALLTSSARRAACGTLIEEHAAGVVLRAPRRCISHASTRSYSQGARRSRGRRRAFCTGAFPEPPTTGTASRCGSGLRIVVPS